MEWIHVDLGLVTHVELPAYVCLGTQPRLPCYLHQMEIVGSTPNEGRPAGHHVALQ